MLEYADLIGRTIVQVRALTKEEMAEADWHSWGPVPVIILDDGTEIVASQDEEGNGPGALFISQPEVSK